MSSYQRVFGLIVNILAKKKKIWYNKRMAYDKKYRKRVLDYIEEGHTWKEAKEIFKVSNSAISHWRNLLKEKGNLEDKEPQRKPKKIVNDELRAYMELHPDEFLSEIAEHFNCTPRAVSEALKRLKITRKKRVKHTKKVLPKSGKNTSGK